MLQLAEVRLFDEFFLLLFKELPNQRISLTKAGFRLPNVF